MMNGSTRIIIEQILQECADSIFHEDFDFGSEDDEDEVFIDDVCFKEKYQSAIVNDPCNITAIPELTDDQWAHMKEQADLMVSLLREAKQNNNSSSTPVVVTVPNSHNIKQSLPVTSSPAMNTRSKRKMQLISNSPYKVSPLQDITNRSIIKPSPGIITPQSIQKLAASKLDASTDQAIYDQLGLVNPMCLNFDDVEHSPQKHQCLNPYFNNKDTPLLTDEAWDVLLLSPDVKHEKTVRESLGMNARVSLDAVTKTRIRSKTFKLDEGSSLLPSLLCPTVSSSKAKESKASYKSNKERSSEVCEPKLKPPRQSILNVSFTIDKNSEAMLGIATPPASNLENVKSSHETAEKPTLNESLTINKSQYRDSFDEKPALNESFTINKSYACDSAGGKPALNESFTINKSIVRISMNGKSNFNESFTMNDSSSRKSMIGKIPLNESSTPKESVNQDVVNEKPVLNESFTMDDSSNRKSMIGKIPLNKSFTLNESVNQVVNEKPVLNESFTIDTSHLNQSVNIQPSMNESFTINKSYLGEVMLEKSTANESFTVEGLQTAEVLNKKTVLNESFTLEKSTLNASFTVDASIDDSLNKSSLQVEGTTLKKKSPLEKSSSLTSSSVNKSTINEKSCEGLKKTLPSRKRTLASVNKTPTHQRSEPPSKTTVVSSFQSNKRQMPTIKSSIIPKTSMYHLQSSKTNFTLKNPNLNFNVSASTLQKDNHGMVKFEEKSVVPPKKIKSSLIVPTKLTRKSLKISPQKPLLKKEQLEKQSPVLGPKRKCLLSTPPLSRIGSGKRAESSLNGNTDVSKTRLVLPSKLQSNRPKADTGKLMPQSRIPNKGPLKALPTLGKAFEMKESNLPFAGKSKLKMPSPVKSRIPQMNFKSI